MFSEKRITDLRIKKVKKGTFKKVYGEVVTDHTMSEPYRAYISISNAYTKKNGELGRNTKKIISKSIRYLSESYGTEGSYLGPIENIKISFNSDQPEILKAAFEKSVKRSEEKHKIDQYADNIFLAAKAKRSLPLLKKMSCC